MSLTEIGSFQIEGRTISVRPVNCFSCESSDDFRPIIGAELYGILRRNSTTQIVLCEKRDFVFIQNNYTDCDFGRRRDEYFRLTNAEMEKFLFYYCNIPRVNKIDWKEFGF